VVAAGFNVSENGRALLAGRIRKLGETGYAEL
jgi:hypothetical protein